jgi:hypothetical protein
MADIDSLRTPAKAKAAPANAVSISRLGMAEAIISGFMTPGR